MKITNLIEWLDIFGRIRHNCRVINTLEPKERVMKKTGMFSSLHSNGVRACIMMGVVFLCASHAQAHVNVTPSQAKALLDADDAPIVIDVREVYEYCGGRGHIPGARNYPWYGGALHSDYPELAKTASYLVVCKSGGRSNAASNFLDSMGFETIYDMGGMGSWQWETVGCVDSDGDGMNDDLDNAPSVYNPFQADTDNDGVGNVTDTDYPRLYVADRVDFQDFAVLAANWQKVGSQLPADLDRDGVVGLGDVLVLAEHWLQ